MSKGTRNTLWVVVGIIAAVVVTLCILLCMGFRFSSESAFEPYYQKFSVIHTDEYDFYVDGTLHETVKKYGFCTKT